MKDNVVKRGGRWAYVVDLGDHPARHCPGVPDRNGKVRRHRVWVDEYGGDACPQKIDRGKGPRQACGLQLGPVERARRQKWVGGFRTREDAKVARRKALGVLDNGGNPFPADVSLAEFAARYLAHVTTQGHLRPRTWAGYERLLDQWVLPDYGSLQLRAFSVRHAQAALDAAVAAGKSPATVRNVRSALSAVFSLAVQWQLVETNPVHASRAPKSQRPDLRIPTAAELRQLIEAAKGSRWEVATLLSATTGARRGEVLAIRWSNVDLDAARLRITESLANGDDGLVFMPPKTRSSVRTVPIPAFAVARLRRHRVEQRERRLRLGPDWHDLDLVCERGDGQPISPNAFTAGFLALAARAGLRGVRLHDLRHGVATVMAKRGASPLATSRMLGHASVTFTQSVYTHADDEMVDLAAASLEAALGE
jgi:integrase